MRYKIKDIPSEGLLVELELPRSLFADALEGTGRRHRRRHGEHPRRIVQRSRRQRVRARGRQGAVQRAVRALFTAVAGQDLGAAEDDVRRSRRRGRGQRRSARRPRSLDARRRSRSISGAIIREQIILGVPMSPRCRDNCLGLCATCGQNKNEHDCGHKPPVLEDPRLAVLKNLKIENIEKGKDHGCSEAKEIEGDARSPSGAVDALGAEAVGARSARVARSRSCRTACARRAATTAIARSSRRPTETEA